MYKLLPDEQSTVPGHRWCGASDSKWVILVSRLLFIAGPLDVEHQSECRGPPVPAGLLTGSHCAVALKCTLWCWIERKKRPECSAGVATVAKGYRRDLLRLSLSLYRFALICDSSYGLIREMDSSFGGFSLMEDFKGFFKRHDQKLTKPNFFLCLGPLLCD